MAIYPCPISMMTNPPSWRQPSCSEIRFTSDGYAVVSNLGVSQLQLLSQPPYICHNGKMWKQVVDDTTYLYWYVEVEENPSKFEIKYRKILSKEVFELLNPGGRDNQ